MCECVAKVIAQVSWVRLSAVECGALLLIESGTIGAPLLRRGGSSPGAAQERVSTISRLADWPSGAKCECVAADVAQFSRVRPSAAECGRVRPSANGAKECEHLYVLACAW